MEKMYFDNACESYPKAGGISDMLREYADLFDAESEAENRMYINDRRTFSCAAKQGIKKLLGCNSDTGIFLTTGITSCVNTLCMTLYKSDMHCVCAFDERHPIISVLNGLKRFGVEFTNVGFDTNGFMDLNEFENSIDITTEFAIVPYASGTVGTLQEIGKISEICKRHGIYLIVDISLAVGQVPVCFDTVKADALIFTADKAMLGLDGIGAIVAGKHLADKLSDYAEILEADIGTLSLHALNESLMFIESIGTELYEKTEQLVICFLYGIKHMRGIELSGSWNSSRRVGIIAIDFVNNDNALCAERLYSEYGIVAYNDVKNGTVRFSVSYFNTFDEVNDVLNAIQTISDEQNTQITE